MNTQEFVAKLEQDAKENNLAILEKILAAGKNPEAVYAIAQEVGVTDSFEAFQAEMQKQYESLSGELTDEELLAIAGGEGELYAVGCTVGVMAFGVGTGLALAA